MIFRWTRPQLDRNQAHVFAGLYIRIEVSGCPIWLEFLNGVSLRSGEYGGGVPEPRLASMKGGFGVRSAIRITEFLIR